ncbi:MAG: hypothetical protein F8N37_12160 [Telmatospirillum sp.]|nr:hypothetical protein [Telmatospirillum sp.]
MLIEQAMQRVRAFRTARGWSILRFAKESGLNESTIRRMDRPDWSPTADTLKKLESIVPNDFFDLPPAAE